jgi:hypothetical protein
MIIRYELVGNNIEKKEKETRKTTDRSSRVPCCGF